MLSETAVRFLVLARLDEMDAVAEEDIGEIRIEVERAAEAF